jgi:hypothetical protein
MPDVTYYVALPFTVSEDGELVAGEAKECQSSHGAIREAQRLASTSAGAVAFSRTGDPGSGEFADAVVIKSFGEVPSAESLLVNG